MPRHHATFLLIAAVWLAGPGLGLAQDISAANSILRDCQQSIAKIRILFRSYDRGDPIHGQFSSDVDAAIQQLKQSRNQFAKIEAAMLGRFKDSFAELHVCEDLPWRVAVRHKPFLAEQPIDVVIEGPANAVSIRKTVREVSTAATYHVSPYLVFNDGDRAAITFSTPVRSAGGGTPIPYFGLRDAQGHEHTLCDLGSFGGDGKKHSILVQRVGNEGLALLDGRLATLQMRPPVEELAPPIFMFFHMNDTSEVVIHSIQFSRPLE